MMHSARHSAIWLNMLVVIFTMNSTVGYGACNLDKDVAQTEARIPCHDADDAHADHEKCCSACFVMVLPLQLVKPIVTNTDNRHPTGPVLLFSSNVDPPFKPPITHLS